MQKWQRIVSGQSQGLLPATARVGLQLLSWPYGAAVAIRNRAFDRGWKRVARFTVPIVSVGNLTLGGTGKTPMIAFLAKWFRSKSLRVAIVSRGYGAGKLEKNDEAMELEKLLPEVPHFQHRDRCSAIEQAKKVHQSQVILLDDGFQHRRVYRDLDIVLLDATNPFGYEQLFPRGLLREPLSSLRRAHVIFASRADLVERQTLAYIRNTVLRYSPKAAWGECCHQPKHFQNHSGTLVDLDHFVHQPCFAFCAIGNPNAFFQTLRALGITVVGTHTFPDHHRFHSDDFGNLLEAAQRAGAKVLLCTAKDLVKCSNDYLGGLPLWSLVVEMQCREGWHPLSDRLEALVGELPSSVA